VKYRFSEEIIEQLMTSNDIDLELAILDNDISDSCNVGSKEDE